MDADPQQRLSLQGVVSDDRGGGAPALLAGPAGLQGLSVQILGKSPRPVVHGQRVGPVYRLQVEPGRLVCCRRARSAT